MQKIKYSYGKKEGNNKYLGNYIIKENITIVLFYNQEMLTESGVDEPPQTWEDLITVGEKIIEKYGSGTAISIVGYNAWDLIHNWAILLRANGGELLSKDYSQAVFNNPAGVDAIDYLIGLIDSGLAADECISCTQIQAENDFISGEVAMCLMGPENITKIEEQGLNYGSIEPPACSNSMIEGTNLVIRASAAEAEIDAARLWIEYLLEKDNLLEYTKEFTLSLPVTEECLNTPYFSGESYNSFKNSLYNAIPYPSLPEWGEIRNTIEEQLKEILKCYEEEEYDRDRAKEYLDQAADAVNDLLSRNK
ncbi:MAG TPA: extracellular solute-binding protein [Halanaerobiales bacterium]|nr:extracellular solute-binding protein [Halanaerobiales bacterium]